MFKTLAVATMAICVFGAEEEKKKEAAKDRTDLAKDAAALTKLVKGMQDAVAKDAKSCAEAHKKKMDGLVKAAKDEKVEKDKPTPAKDALAAQVERMKKAAALLIRAGAEMQFSKADAGVNNAGCLKAAGDDADKKKTCAEMDKLATGDYAAKKDADFSYMTLKGAGQFKVATQAARFQDKDGKVEEIAACKKVLDAAKANLSKFAPYKGFCAQLRKADWATECVATWQKVDGWKAAEKAWTDATMDSAFGGAAALAMGAAVATAAAALF